MLEDTDPEIWVKMMSSGLCPLFTHMRQKKEGESVKY